LVVGDYASHRAAERALTSMVEAAASGTLSAPSGGRSGGKPGSFHRSAYLAPPMAHSAAPGAIADASAILIELGQSGGPNPHQTERVESLLSRQLNAAGFDTAAWSDLAALEVAVLHPAAHSSRSCCGSTTSPVTQKPRPASIAGRGSAASSTTSGRCSVDRTFSTYPDGPLAGRLRTEHEVAMRDLYYGTDEPPTFDDVLERVQASRELLDIKATT
jgi:hypothetical protein